MYSDLLTFCRLLVKFGLSLHKVLYVVSQSVCPFFCLYVYLSRVGSMFKWQKLESCILPAITQDSVFLYGNLSGICKEMPPNESGKWE